MAYGQTGTGKTYTMEGGQLGGPTRGIIPRAIEDVFSHITAGSGTGGRCRFLVRASYLQIYNEVISDLLKPEATNLTIREDRRRGVHVEGLPEWVVRTPGEVYEPRARGAAARATGATTPNEISSRSHAIFMLIVEKSTAAEGGAGAAGGALADVLGRPPSRGGEARPGHQSVRVGKLNLVDLAGSERVHVTGATGKRLEESKKINQSLSALGNVISALTDPKGRDGRPHIPYRCAAARAPTCGRGARLPLGLVLRLGLSKGHPLLSRHLWLRRSHLSSTAPGPLTGGASQPRAETPS